VSDIGDISEVHYTLGSMFRAIVALLLGYLTAGLVAAVVFVVQAWGTPGTVAAFGLLLIFPALPFFLWDESKWLTLMGAVFVGASSVFWIVLRLRRTKDGT
jgi:hypothetical protein